MTAANLQHRNLWVLKILIFFSRIYQNSGFRPQISHFWSKICRQVKDFPTNLTNPKIYREQCPLSSLPLQFPGRDATV